MNSTGASNSPNTAICSSVTTTGSSPPLTGTATPGPCTTLVVVTATEVDGASDVVDVEVGAGAVAGAVTVVVAGVDSGAVDDLAVPQLATSTHTTVASTRGFMGVSGSCPPSAGCCEADEGGRCR